MSLQATAVGVPVAAVTVRRPEWLARFVAVTVALLPFLIPAAPGNSSLPDVGIAVSIVLLAMWVTRDRLPLSFPYVFGVGGLVVGGMLAAATASAPVSVAFVVVQEIVLLLWATVLAMGWRNPTIIKAATRAWCVTAPLYAGAMVVAYLLSLDSLAGVTAEDGVRASYTFGDPNLAANYLITSLFIMLACRYPRRPMLRHFGYLVVLLAIVFTGSNGGMVTLVIGTVLAAALGLYHHGEPMAAVLVIASAASGAVMLFGYVLPNIDVEGLQNRAASSVPLIRDSLGRSGESGSERATIVSEGMRLWLRGDATGYGPARTKTTLSGSQASYVKEAHNDYLATLLERGVVGAVGLMVLVGAIGVRCVRVAFRPLPMPFREIVPRAWLLTVVGPMMATAALFYEVLHFRHLWTWLGILAALDLALRHHERDTT
jgi:O-Antigen ligase